MAKSPKITTVAPDKLWQITLRFPPIIGVATNCWLWKGEDGLTLIDCGYPVNGEEILAASRELGEIRSIIITHAHPDHAGSAAALSRALSIPVLAHEAELDYLQGKKTMHTEDGSMICKCILWMAHNTGFALPKVNNVQPLKSGEQIDGLELLHTPGHTPGSISLFAPETRSLFCGDNFHTLFPKPTLGHLWFTLDGKMRNASLSQFEKLNAKTLLAGHGKPYVSDNLTAELKQINSRSAR